MSSAAERTKFEVLRKEAESLQQQAQTAIKAASDAIQTAVSSAKTPTPNRIARPSARRDRTQPVSS